MSLQVLARPVMTILTSSGLSMFLNSKRSRSAAVWM